MDKFRQEAKGPLSRPLDRHTARLCVEVTAAMVPDHSGLIFGVGILRRCQMSHVSRIFYFNPLAPRDVNAAPPPPPAFYPPCLLCAVVCVPGCQYFRECRNGL